MINKYYVLYNTNYVGMLNNGSSRNVTIAVSENNKEYQRVTKHAIPKYYTVHD